MSEARKAARLVFPGFRFGLDDPGEAAALAEMGVGGFCLYGGEVSEVSAFTSRLQGLCGNRLLFCADYENGVASQCAGGTALSSNMGLGAAASETLAYQKGAITALEARAIGVRWVLAPVVDLATLASNPIVNIRSFSSDPATVARLARAYLKGLKSEGVLSCLKHFPGHGETLQDSHLEMPLVKVSRSVLEKRELVPYRELAGEADAVMTAHLSVPALEKGKGIPYSLSADVKRTLRGALGFKGMVSTDALSMRAITKHCDELEAARRALLGGADILLVPEKPRELVRGLMAAVGESAELRAAAAAAAARIERARAPAGARGEPRGADASELRLVASRKHRETAERMAESCLAWAGEAAGVSPGEKIRYWEPEAASPDEWRGRAFIGALRESGLEIAAPDQAARKGETLIIGSFLSPHAYTGRIEYGPAEVRRIRSALSRAARALIVSFGSPFVFEALGARGLCAFSSHEAAQRAAAKALAGAIEVRGRMPVALRLETAGEGSCKR